MGGERFVYTVWRPPGYESSRRWPGVVFLHGAGECGRDGEKPTGIGLGPALAAHPERWPFVVVFPQKPREEEEWEEREDLVLAVVRDALRRERIDPARVALTGMSQGGHGAWMIAARSPRMWSAVVPVGGYGRPRTIASRVRGLPVWAFHGGEDDVVLPRESELVVAEIRRLRSAPGSGDSAGARLTIYPRANHNSWDSAYAEPELPGWLLAQRREGGAR